MTEDTILAAALVRTAHPLTRDAVMYAFCAFFAGTPGFDRAAFVQACKEEE